jgi:hypothetical protein
MNYINLYNGLEKDAGLGSIFSNAIKSVKNRIGGSTSKAKPITKTIEQPIPNTTFKQKIIQPSELSKYTDIAKTRNYTKGSPDYSKMVNNPISSTEPIKKKMGLGKKIMIGAGVGLGAGAAGTSWLNNKNNDETKMASNGGPDFISRMKNWRNLQKKNNLRTNLNEYNLLNKNTSKGNLGKTLETKLVANTTTPAPVKKKWSTGKKIGVGLGGAALLGASGIGYLNRNNNANATDNQLG